jgi:hypothetical protein
MTWTGSSIGEVTPAADIVTTARCMLGRAGGRVIMSISRFLEHRISGKLQAGEGTEPDEGRVAREEGRGLCHKWPRSMVGFRWNAYEPGLSETFV